MQKRRAARRMAGLRPVQTWALFDAPLLRLTVMPSSKNDLQKPSQVMIDKILAVRRDRVGAVFGSLEADILTEVERRLAVFLGIAK